MSPGAEGGQEEAQEQNTTTPEGFRFHGSTPPDQFDTVPLQASCGSDPDPFDDPGARVSSEGGGTGSPGSPRNGPVRVDADGASGPVTS
jgi:hypothetical protein